MGKTTKAELIETYRKEFERVFTNSKHPQHAFAEWAIEKLASLEMRVEHLWAGTKPELPTVPEHIIKDKPDQDALEKATLNIDQGTQVVIKLSKAGTVDLAILGKDSNMSVPLKEIHVRSLQNSLSRILLALKASPDSTEVNKGK